MPEKARSFPVVPPSRYIRFGPFEIDSRAGELRKHGIKIKVQQQGLQILLMLLKHPGEVVLREEIRGKLWPNDTVVEFDHSINAAIQKLRDALGESAGKPGYIETLPRRGYRFIGTAEAAAEEETGESTAAPPETVDAAPLPANRQPVRQLWRWPVMAAASLLLGALAIALWLFPRTSRPPLENWTLALGTGRESEVSPDGSAVVDHTSSGLFLRRMDSPAVVPLYALGPVVDEPIWSADSSQLLFNTLRGLTRLPLPNGPPLIVWPKMGVTRGYAWSPDGTIVSTIRSPEGIDLQLLRAQGGDPIVLKIPGFTGGWFYYPEFLPDGKNLLFAWGAGRDFELGLYLTTLEKGKITRAPALLRKNWTAGRYSPSAGGSLLYVQDDKLYAQKLNVRRGTLEGQPHLVVEGAFSDIVTHRAYFSVSRNGVLVWGPGRAGLAQLTWFGRAGQVLGTAGPPCLAASVLLSPDEQHVLTMVVADRIVYGIVEAHQSGYSAVPWSDHLLWMPDGSHLLGVRTGGSGRVIFERTVEGGAEKELARMPQEGTLHDVSSDGKTLLYMLTGSLYTIGLDGSPPSQPHLVAEATRGRFSPDGRWVVYSTIIGNGRGVYVQPLAAHGLRTQLAADGEAPVWRGDGREILYLSRSTIYGVPVEVKGDSFHAGTPQALFQIRRPAGLVGDTMPMAVTRDGSRILFAQGVEQPDPHLIYVKTAWEKAVR